MIYEYKIKAVATTETSVVRLANPALEVADICLHVDNAVNKQLLLASPDGLYLTVGVGKACINEATTNVIIAGTLVGCIEGRMIDNVHVDVPTSLDPCYVRCAINTMLSCWTPGAREPNLFDLMGRFRGWLPMSLGQEWTVTGPDGRRFHVKRIE